MTTWTQADVPSQKGRTILVTGTSGIGLQAAIALARAGAGIIIAGRNEARGTDAVATLLAAVPGATAGFEGVDLADLASVRTLGTRLRDRRVILDVVLNNAGLMAPPKRGETVDGFELQFGTNYLGSFALTREILPLFRYEREPRVVTIGSFAVHGANIDFDDLQSRQRYNAMRAYAQSKLADLLFALELQRRSDANGWGITSIAAHPGLARTQLVAKSAGDGVIGRMTRLIPLLLGQSSSRGALPIIFAATSPDAKGGHYYGPNGFRELRGTPGEARVPAIARDATIATRLWDVSQALTGGPSEATAWATTRRSGATTDRPRSASPASGRGLDAQVVQPNSFG